MTGDAALQELIARAGEDARILGVILFGSAARGEPVRGSDVDVCLVLDARKEEDPSRIRLEYLTLFDLDIQVFQWLPLYVRSRVLKEGKVLHVKDEEALYALALRTAKAFEDFKPHYRRYLEAVLHAGS